MADGRAIPFARACAMYVHRFTCEHVPAWAREQRPDGKFYAPQYATDREWYALTAFPGEPGHPGTRRDPWCYSTGQTWPHGQSLDRPHEPHPAPL